MSTSRTESQRQGRHRLRLTRAERLRGRSAITTVFRDSRRVGGGGLALLYKPNGLDANRLLVSARRGFAGAVERNRERRRVKEIYRLLKPRLRSGYDIAAVVAPPPCSTIDRSAQFETLLRKAGLLLS
jgi:ribonuclease P protein component